MAPIRKSKSFNKRFTNEASPGIDVGNSSKTKQRKKKLTDKLGPRWTRGELERFYDAYRKHGRDCKKVAVALRSNRSVDMVEALFNMNRAYLSLPEGTASVAGLIAMMTDHYSVIEESESEGEGHDDFEVPRKHHKHHKRKHAKLPPNDFRVVIPPLASAEGCLSFLRQIPAFVSERRATEKRTPRFPVPSTYNGDDREGSTPPSKRAKKQHDGDAHVVASTLAAESRREGGYQYRSTELNDSRPTTLGKMAKVAQSKHHNSSMFENGMRISRDRRHKNGASGRDGAFLLDMEGVGAVEVPRKGKNGRVEKAKGNDSHASKEACSANEELRTTLQKGIVDIEASKEELDAVDALGVLSSSMPLAGLMESDSSAQLKEERMANGMNEKSNTPETVSTNYHRQKAKQVEPEDSRLHAMSAVDNRKVNPVQESIDGNAIFIGGLDTSKRKRKLKVVGVKALTDSIQKKSLYNKEAAEDDNLTTLVKARHAGQGPAKHAGQGPAKQLNIAKTSEETASTSDKKRTGLDAVISATQVSGPVPVSLSQKPPNRRKMSLKKSLQQRAQSSEITHVKPHDYENLSEHELLKEMLSTCLSYPLVRRRCIFEWFYSSIDYPWFTKMEFIDYLNHVGLGHVPRLTRLEWSVIKSSLGRPRRFSERFIQEERGKLNQYRETVRKHYTELRGGAREGLPTDLAPPLSVGNRVIAIHPKSREIRDGKILTVDHNKCNILFDELSVDLVMDIDCMPLNPLEYIPENLRRKMDKCLSISKDRFPNSDASVLFPHSGLENFNFSMKPSVKQSDINGPNMHGKMLAINTSDFTSKARESEIQRALVPQHTSNAQEMEPEMIEIYSGSKSRAQTMVEAAMKVASSMKKDEDTVSLIKKAFSSIGEHHSLVNSIGPGIKQQEQTNGSLDHHQNGFPSNTAKPMTNGFISQDGSGKTKTQMPLELITSCVATWLMIQRCTEKQYPPADVAELMETAVSSLQPRCPQNMPIYREIQTCMGLIKSQIMSLVRT